MNNTLKDYNLYRRRHFAGKPQHHALKIGRILARMWYRFGFNLELEP